MSDQDIVMMFEEIKELAPEIAEENNLSIEVSEPVKDRHDWTYFASIKVESGDINDILDMMIQLKQIGYLPVLENVGDNAYVEMKAARGAIERLRKKYSV